ncbi:MAG: acyl carrier protein [Lachnospiraceae bacterium]|nr:acyl carrier protein [Lachnospiraceae bacterium]
MDELLEILEELHSDIDFEVEDRLVDDKILDSFDLVTLVTELGDQFDIEITAKDFIPENFNSAAAMWAMIQRLMEE